MVCVGHTNSCPSHPGYYPPLSAVNWGAAADTNRPIYADDFYYIFYYTELERSRWMTYYNAVGGAAYRFTGYYGSWSSPSYGNFSWYTRPGTKDTNSVVYAYDWRMIRDQIIACVGGTYPTYNFSAWTADAYVIYGGPIYAATLNDIRTRINELRTWCICNCNYTCTCNCNYCTCNCNYACTCNCNYCPCNCNYCPCNCNYCPCNCNYSCTCNCNYSCPCNCNEGGTCVIAGSLILMADGSQKKIEDVQVGDMVQSVFGTVAVDKLDPTILGDRRMMTFSDESLFWSEEHPMWVRKDGKEWWWSAGPEMWFRELRNGITVGLKDNFSIMSGVDNIEFATIKGWEFKEVVESKGWLPETPLYSFGAAGAPIIVNGYVMTSHTNEFIYDYTKIRWSGK